MTTIDVPHSSRSAVLTVSGVIEETPDSRSLVFDVPADMKSKFQYKPGQFLTLRIPERSDRLGRALLLPGQLAVHRRRPQGHRQAHRRRLRLQLAVRQPEGGRPARGAASGRRLHPKSLDHDFLLFGGGSGITPVMSILKSALTQGGGKVVLLYGNRDVESVIFAAELRELAAKYPDRLTIIHWIETVQGLPSVTQLATLVSPYTSYEALCVARPVMDTIHEALAQAGMPRSQVHAEVFNSLSGDPFADVELEEVTAEEAADAATVEIELDGEKHNLSWPRKQTLVDVMLSKGLDVPYSCQEGECGSCACTVLEGEVSMEHAGVLDEEDIANGYILGCQAKPGTDHLKIEF